MRAMLLFRGSPACGKSTMIDKLNLKDYTLSADEIRLLLQSPTMTVEGDYSISQDNEKTVWRILMDALEARMKRGEFVVIDATNSKTSDMQKYKALSDTYRYRIYLIDMTNIPIDIVKERNINRLPKYKVVPEYAIDNMYARFSSQNIPSGIKVLDNDNEDYIKQMSFNTIDFSHYNKIHHIGDVHGCYTVLKKYMDESYNEEDLYIFTGDYTDRGIENKETLNYLFDLSSKSNIIFLEGNHEIHLRNWANDIYSELPATFKATLPEIEGGQVSKKEARKFCRKLRQFAYYNYGDKVTMVTHGGVPKIIENTLFMPTVDMIRGVGKYEDSLAVDLAFETNMPSNYYQIHGHRNIEDLPVRCTNRCFNLEGGVEMGGHLRIVTLDKKGFETIEIQNDVFSAGEAIDANNLEVVTQEMMFNLMQDNSLVAEKKSKKYPISAFNFKNAVFKGRLWDSQTIKARGLFFNNETKEIIMRSYDKFFNIKERENTKLHNLKRSMEFPVNEYLKYNGFLGLQSVFEDELIYASKSSLESEHAKWFKQIFEDSTTDEQRGYIKNLIKEHKSTFIYEVIDPINDPHIIKYDKPFVVLIAVVKNEVEFNQLSYDDLIKIGKETNLKVKERTCTINNWSELYERINTTNEENYKHNGLEHIEGYVYEGKNSFMTKSKLHYYKQWKLLRGVSQTFMKYNHISYTGALNNPETNLFYGWLRNQPKEEIVGKDIITLREMFRVK
ncbi:RNA ligase [Metaclostridioides mangenotii]|uniref:RNA ligase n=1 Tax=Metaclostridioides mangenotii TaxID=1540 RepID=UPI00046689D5|nr:RNA ligase [Clostridioides mangenotii]